MAPLEEKNLAPTNYNLDFVKLNTMSKNQKSHKQKILSFRANILKFCNYSSGEMMREIYKKN